MKKHVWIMNHYAGGMYFDKGGRHYNFAKYLKRAGYEPVVFCANSKHGSPEIWFPDGPLWQEHPAEEIGVPFVFVKARTYTGNGKQRILNMIDFYRNVKKAAGVYAAKNGKPDVICASSVHPLTLVAGIQLAKRFGVECICEVRDLWPESLVTYGLLKRGTPLAGILYAGEKWIYKKADRLIFTMEGAYDYIMERGWGRAVPRSKVYYINNGVDLEAFHHNREHCPVRDPDLEDPETLKVVYAGAVRRINRVGTLLDAAKQVKDPGVKFLIWGDGDELPALRRRAEAEQIKNVVFKGRVNKTYIPSIVSQADFNCTDSIGGEIARFGLSRNKMFDYFAAGKPLILWLQASTTRYNPAEEFSCGFPCETEAELPGILEHAAALSKEEYAGLCRNALRAAEAFEFENLTKDLIEILEA